MPEGILLISRGPITKSDMHHSEINSQQRTHVLFVMSRSKLRAPATRGEGWIARKMSAGMVAGSGYLSSELPVNDNPWVQALCPAKPLFPCISAVSLPFRIFLRSSFLISSRDLARVFHPFAPVLRATVDFTDLSKFILTPPISRAVLPSCAPLRVQLEIGMTLRRN